MNPAMINKLRRMQKEMEQTQARITSTEYSAGYQGVKISMLGSKEITRVEIDNALMDDKDMLEELIQVAVNAASKEVDKAFDEAMKPYQSLMGGLGF